MMHALIDHKPMDLMNITAQNINIQRDKKHIKDYIISCKNRLSEIKSNERLIFVIQIYYVKIPTTVEQLEKRVSEQLSKTKVLTLEL